MSTLELYRSATGYRWRFKTRNSRIIANGGEAYHRRRDMIKALTILFPTFIDGAPLLYPADVVKNVRVQDTTRPQKS